MYFDFLAFIEELRNSYDKKEIVEKYEKFFGKITGDIKDQIWYKEYLINFGYQDYCVPEELIDDFDWNLLLQLVYGSFSSEVRFIETENSLLDLEITVKLGEQTITKTVSELWSYQILRLFEIYIEEQMNLQILINEEKNNADAILRQRQLRLERFGVLVEKKTSSSKITNITGLFNFHTFIEHLREDIAKKEIIEKYEKFFGKIIGDVKDQLWYKEYLEKFDYIPYEVPEELQLEFDWDILLKLVAGSFSSRCKMKLENDNYTFNIEVGNNNNIIDKNIGELWSFQILRLFEIYIEEAMNLQILLIEEQNDKDVIILQREIRIDEWNKHLINLKTQNELNNLLED